VFGGGGWLGSPGGVVRKERTTAKVQGKSEKKRPPAVALNPHSKARWWFKRGGGKNGTIVQKNQQ